MILKCAVEGVWVYTLAKCAHSKNISDMGLLTAIHMYLELYSQK